MESPRGTAPQPGTGDVRTDPHVRADWIGNATLGSVQLVASSPLTAEEIAARLVMASPRFAQPETDSFDIIDWEGTTADTDGAHVTMRVTSTLSGGMANRCWKLTFFDRATHAFDAQVIDCPDSPARIPAMPALTPFDRERIVDIMTETLSTTQSDRLQTAVEAALADHAEYVASTEHEGEFVVVARGPGEKECVLGVRHADGNVETFTSFRKNALLLGEMGCDPGLYFAELYQR